MGYKEDGREDRAHVRRRVVLGGDGVRGKQDVPGRLQGHGGDDLVRAGSPERPNDGARDVLDCGGGTDALKGKGGGDRIFGGEGNDIVKGGDGTDRVDGGDGNDIVRGGTHSAANDRARDVLICGPGRDKVFFVRGQDVLRGCEIKRPSN
jgi:Ca2+-binding RTX toxin-like protein